MPDAVLVADRARSQEVKTAVAQLKACLLYTSDAADERSSVDLGGRRIIKKKTYQLSSKSGGIHEEQKTGKQEMK